MALHIISVMEPSLFFVRACDDKIEIALPSALTAAGALVLAVMLIRAADQSFDYGAFRSIMHAMRDRPSLEMLGHLQPLPIL